ncbi:FAD-dependent oxidoreductase [Qipengyuania nanhaisediminis]|uniref:FAD-dependent oxidoreductase n=1 Tax=Qipengyuania nanhaisediminis TaxID=604088 RepID=UPI0038B3A384
MSAGHALLVGGGHAHVAVLEDWIANGLPCASASVLSPDPLLHYSGMVPGVIARRYRKSEGTVEIAALAERAGARYIAGRCVAIDPDAREVRMEGGQALEFDIASLDTGGVSAAERVLGHDDRIVAVRPIARFVDDLGRVLARREPCRIAVVGGGAGGVELAFALRNGDGGDAVTLVTGAGGLLPDHAPAARRLAARELLRQRIAIASADARIENGELSAGPASLEPVELIVPALGSDPPHWLGKSTLACDEAGFVSVDAHQRSISHPFVFAAGDVAARLDWPVPRSGVHAVKAGPVLAANLRALCEGREPLASHKARRAHLYLMATGRGEAIASFGPFAAQGRWLAALKHGIDTRWIAHYADLARGA